MKVKLISIALGAALVTGYMAYAQEEPDQGRPGQEERFAERKSKILEDLTERKAGIENNISCITAAKAKEDMQKCNEERKAHANKMKERKLSERKERLQDELKKLEEKSKDSKQ